MKKLLGAVFLTLGLLYGALCYATSFTFKNDIDYLTLPTIPSVQNNLPKNKITVIEFFSYGCPSCYTLEPYLQKWLSTKPLYVDFYRVPVEFQPQWILYARTFYIAQQLGMLDTIGPQLFKTIIQKEMDLTKMSAMTNFFAEHGVAQQQFLASYHSSLVENNLAKDRRLTHDVMIFQVPGIIIDGKYKVDPSFSGANNARLISILNYLIDKEAQEKKLIIPKVVAPPTDYHAHIVKSG